MLVTKMKITKVWVLAIFSSFFCIFPAFALFLWKIEINYYLNFSLRHILVSFTEDHYISLLHGFSIYLLILFMYKNVLPACVHAYTYMPDTHGVLKKCQSLWSWGSRWLWTAMWVLRTKPLILWKSSLTFNDCSVLPALLLFSICFQLPRLIFKIYKMKLHSYP